MRSFAVAVLAVSASVTQGEKVTKSLAEIVEVNGEVGTCLLEVTLDTTTEPATYRFESSVDHPLLTKEDSANFWWCGKSSSGKREPCWWFNKREGDLAYEH